MAVDDDPVFAQTLVTLFRVIPTDELDRTFRSVAQVLYRNRIQRTNGRPAPDLTEENAPPTLKAKPNPIRM
jgi:hypothetical protein